MQHHATMLHFISCPPHPVRFVSVSVPKGEGEARLGLGSGTWESLLSLVQTNSWTPRRADLASRPVAPETLTNRLTVWGRFW